jgi:hypothetical protein
VSSLVLFIVRLLAGAEIDAFARPDAYPIADTSEEARTRHFIYVQLFHLRTFNLLTL